MLADDSARATRTLAWPGLALGLCLLAAALPARADDLQTVLGKYVAWRGGAAFEAMRSIHERGTARHGDLHGVFEEWSGWDGSLRQTAQLGPIAANEAVSPTSEWTTDTSGQVGDIGDGGDSDRRLTLLAFAPDAARAGGARFALMAPEQRDGRQWDVVRASFGGGDTYDLFIDPQSGELLGERVVEDQQSRFETFGDWRMVLGVRLPFSSESRGANSADDEDEQTSLVEIDVPLSQVLFARPPEVRRWSFAGGAATTGWIDFEFYGGLEIYIPATVNDHPAKLLLDSGAGISMLDSGFARASGIASGGTVGVTGTSGQSSMQLAPNLRISMGGLTLGPLTAGVFDLSPIAAQVNHPIPAMLGREVFSALVVDIDFANHQIAFDDPQTFTPPPGAVRVPLGLHGANHTVPVSIEGAPPEPFDFDLGNAGALIVYAAYRDRMHLLDSRPQSLDLNGGIGGIRKTKIATIASLQIGGVTISGVPAEFPDAGSDAVSSDRAAGNLGLLVLSRFRVITDYPHGALWLVPNPGAVARPFRKDRTGLIGLPDAGGYKVMLVAPGSPAERAGWKVGDEVVSIEGQKVGPGFALSPAADWNARPAGAIITFGLADGSTRALTLADYY